MSDKSHALDIYAAIKTDTHMYIKCRLLRKSLFGTDYNKGVINSIITTFKAALTKELAHTSVQLIISGKSIPLVTDDEGYLEWMTSEKELLSGSAADISIAVDDSDQIFSVNLIQYNEEIERGVISDIDDTILMTNVKSLFKLKMVFNSVFLNPFRRKPIDKSADLYRRLRGDVKVNMPIIYISNSPWNMYYYLQSFLKHNKFPSGILLLRDFGLQMLQKKKPLELRNKFLLVEKMLTIFPETKFTLIGDSAEHDYDIYMKIMYRYPDRVKDIIIRTASNNDNEKRIRESIAASSEDNIKVVSSYDEILLLQ